MKRVGMEKLVSNNTHTHTFHLSIILSIPFCVI